MYNPPPKPGRDEQLEVEIDLNYSSDITLSPGAAIWLIAAVLLLVGVSFWFGTIFGH